MEENVGYVSYVPFKYKNVCKAILKASKSNPFEFNTTHSIFLLSLLWHYIKLLQKPCSGEVYIHWQTFFTRWSPSLDGIMERLQNSMHACLGTDLTKQFDFPFMCLSHFNPILCIEEKGNVRFPPSKKNCT